MADDASAKIAAGVDQGVEAGKTEIATQVSNNADAAAAELDTAVD